MVNHPNRSQRSLEKLVRNYAQALIDDLGEDDVPTSLIALAAKADLFTAPYIAALLLIENERLADFPYRQFGKFFDERLAEIASKIQWVTP